MRVIPIVTISLIAVSASAQRPPVPPTPAAPPVAGIAPVLPMPAATPMPALAPTPFLDAFAFDFAWPQDREAARRIAEQAREEARRAAEIAREQMRADMDVVREQARAQAELAREDARLIAPRALADARVALGDIRVNIAPPAISVTSNYSVDNMRPARPWAQSDPADSLYRAAYDALNQGDYRKAAALFKDLPVKFPYSAYAPDAMYWQAHSLYRVGSTPDLREALTILETLRQKYPSARLRNSQNDVAALQTRIAGVMSARGEGGSDIVKRALSTQGAPACDSEDQQVRAAALSALMQTDPTAATDYATKILARKDDCSRELRRSAIFLIGERRDPKTVSTLIGIAKSDPASDVRSVAVSYLSRMPGDEAVAALEDLLKTSDDQQVQREAIRSLARSANPRARAGIKALVERNDANESLRITALDALDQERATSDDVAWLQGLYPKVESTRLRARIISAMARLGGTQNEKWFATLANNENESLEVRIEAMRRAGQSMDVPSLGRLYDQTGQRQIRSEIIRQLGNRKEGETVDKLADIAKNGTDPELRRRAIEALTNKKDERATKVLLSLVDRPEKE